MMTFRSLYSKGHEHGHGAMADLGNGSAGLGGAADFDMLSDGTALQREAMDRLWFILSGQATEDDLAALDRWKNQSDAHARALASAARFRRLIADQTAFDRTTPTPLQRPATRRAVLGGGTLAAAALGMVAPPLALWPSVAELSADYRTAVGERQRLEPGNGVLVEMNTRTSMKMRSAAGRPGIELIAGEVAVTTDLPDAHPFRCYAGNCRILAGKASLDLRYDNDKVWVFCAGGMLKIKTGKNQKTLRARERILVAGGQIDTPATVDPVLVTSWRQGRLVFHDASFGEIVDEINRYRPGRIFIADRDLAGRRFNAVFEIAQIANVVPDLQRFSQASVTYLPGNIAFFS